MIALDFIDRITTEQLQRDSTKLPSIVSANQKVDQIILVLQLQTANYFANSFSSVFEDGFGSIMIKKAMLVFICEITNI